MKLLTVQDLSIQFKSASGLVQAVKSLSFDLNESEILGIVGESGSGKSVTAMSITKLLSSNAVYASGSIKFIEKDLKAVELLTLSENELRAYRGNKISIIFQEPMSALNPVLTCGYQLAESLLSHQICSKKEVHEVVKYWFSKVGLTETDRIYKSYPHQLSGGQLQRVLIALALCCNPKLVIADEPTTALDVSIQKKILELLLELKKELGLTIIFISHDLSVVKFLCDRVLVMKQGIKIEENTVGEIFNYPVTDYTKGLIYCRPNLTIKLRRLPTIQDFENNNGLNWYRDENVINNTEQDRIADQLSDQSKIIRINDLNIKFVQKRNWLGKVTKELHAVKNVNLNINSGEVLGLVGESGSGKSSLGKAILGLTKVDSGSVFYGDINISQLNNRNWRPLRKEIQIIFQDPYSSLNPRKSIDSALTEPMLVNRMYNSSLERKERAIELLELVGLKADHMSRYPHQFSGGQRQRICIARALALSPKFIVCDESVSALDVSIQAQVLNLLLELKLKFKLSLLFITHDLSVVNYIADRVVVMNQGTIVEEGLPYQIISNPKSEYTKSLINAIV
ncbi:MAG: ABC transporter ATP-binding protein [Saprospiraceae bacterium]